MPIKIYAGCIYTGTLPWRFQVDAIPVTDEGCLGLKADAPYFQSPNYSSYYFENRIFDKPIEITDELTLFYSKDEEMAMEFLVDYRAKAMEKAKLAMEKAKLLLSQAENAVFVGLDGMERKEFPEDCDRRLQEAESGMEM